jgi:hypothetical protein
MNLLRGLVLACAACSLPWTALAQSLKSEIVGTWLVTSVADQYDSGQQVNNWGTVKGQLSFDGGGRFTQIIIGDAQPALKSPDPRTPDAPVVAFYGTYTVDEAKKIVSFNLEAASWSPRVGAAMGSTVEIKGGVMTLTGSARQDQRGTFRPRVELKRAGGV